jgi:hypothetical protein
MGARAVPLAELTHENTEVRGFNGRATVNCGFSLPIVWHQPTGLYCALSVTRMPGPVWSTEDEIRELEALGRVTLLSQTERLQPGGSAPAKVTYTPMPILLPSSWNDIPRKQPIAIWVKELFLRHLSTPENDLFYLWVNDAWWYKAVPSDADSMSQRVFETFYVACSYINKAESRLDWWGKRAKHLFDTELAKEHPDWHWLKSLADDGLCAARDHGLRYWLYVRSCAALYFGFEPEPERAYRIFQVFIQAAYQGVTWERFREEMFVIVRRAHDVRRLAAMEHRAVSPPVE